MNTETYYTTHTFTRTLEGETTPITSQEVITQVIITEGPSVTRSSVTEAASPLPMVVTKTYLTTFTYYSTGVINDVTQVETDTVVSSEIVTETLLITPQPSVPAVQITKTPAPSLDSRPEDLVYATRTFYTTSTHLTTLLEGGNTVTTSSIEVNSRIITGTLDASNLMSIKDSEIIMPTTGMIKDMPQTEAYVHIDGNVYKQLQTHFATYTHYTTLIDGSVNSREVTETNIDTATVTTDYVPETLLISPTKTLIEDYNTEYDYIDVDLSNSPIISPSSVGGNSLGSSAGFRRQSVNLQSSQVSLSSKPARFSSGTQILHSSTKHPHRSSTAGLNPSQLSSLKASIVSSQNTPGASVVQLAPSGVSTLQSTVEDNEGLQATVMVQGDKTGTKIVGDSENTATILVGSSESVDDYSSHTLVSTSILSIPTVLRNINGETNSVAAGHTVAIVERHGQQTVLPAIPAVLRPAVSLPIPVQVSNEPTPEVSDAAVQSNSQSTGSLVGSGVGLGLMVPVLSAVGAMIKKNMPAVGVGPIAKIDRDQPPVDLPRNILVRMEEPQFIPVGGLGSSMNNERRATISPSDGFVPFNRFSGEVVTETTPLPRPIQEIGGHSRGGHFNVPVFGGFKPPSTTERGFTAIFTTGVIPTHVSVISGKETILFGDGLNKPLPPPGLPAPIDGDFPLFQSSFSDRGNRPVPQPELVEPIEITAELPLTSESRINTSPSFVQAAPVEPKTIVSVEGHNRIVKTHVIEAIPMDHNSQFTLTPDILLQSTVSVDDVSQFTLTPEILLQSTVGVGKPLSSTIDDSLVDNQVTTVVNGVSTVMSGATTIFGSLFTKPVTTVEAMDHLTSIVTGDDGQVTKLISKIDTIERTLTTTITDVKTVAGFLTTVTEIVERTLPQQTIVSTVIGTTTNVNTVTVTSQPLIPIPVEEDITTTDINFTDRNIPSFAEHDDVETLSTSDGASLGLAEENEISRVVASHSPDQEVALRSSIELINCRVTCQPTLNEVCKEKLGEHICVCRPGFSRDLQTNKCKSKLHYEILLNMRYLSRLCILLFTMHACYFSLFLIYFINTYSF